MEGVCAFKREGVMKMRVPKSTLRGRERERERKKEEWVQKRVA